MRRVALLVPVMAFLAVAGSRVMGAGQQAAPPIRPAVLAARSVAPDRARIRKYCIGCHSDRLKTGGLSRQDADPAAAALDASLWEKVVEKLHGGMMPPQGMPRPDAPVLDQFVASLESALDRQANA